MLKPSMEYQSTFISGLWSPDLKCICASSLCRKMTYLTLKQVIQSCPALHNGKAERKSYPSEKQEYFILMRMQSWINYRQVGKVSS